MVEVQGDLPVLSTSWEAFQVSSSDRQGRWMIRFPDSNGLQEETWMFETKQGSRCLGRIKILGSDLSWWRWSRRGCGQVWLGGCQGVILQEIVLLSTFGAFITPSSFLRWRLLFVHLSYFQQGEHIGWCHCFARSLSLIPSVKITCSVWMLRSKPYRCVSVFGLLLSNFFQAELWWDSHRLLSFQKADFFFFFCPREKSDWSQDPWQDSLWKGVTRTFHISIKEGG